MAELKVQIDKLEGAENWSKWKWQMQMHFEQYDLTSIVNGTRVLPVAVSGDVDSNKKVTEWRRDNAKAAALIASTLSPSVTDLVMTYTSAKDIWDKLLSVFEQSSIQRLNLLMTQFFQVSKDPNDNVATHAAKVERIFAEMNNELTRIGSSSIPPELLHGKILLTVGPEYQEFNNVWESLDSEKRTTKNLVEKLCTIEQRAKSAAAVDYGAFAARAPILRQKAVRNSENISETAHGGNTKPSKQRHCFRCGSNMHLCKECPKKKFNDRYQPSKNNKGAFSASECSTQPDIWICDSGASHHMTANKQYFETYKHFPVPIEISLADKSKIYAYGSGKINIEVCIHGKWYDAHMENVWYVPDVRRHLFSVQQAAKHGVEVKMTDKSVRFFRSNELVAAGSWTDGTYVMSMRVVIPACPAEISIATESEALQLWHERLGHQNKRHVRKLLNDMNIHVKHAVTSEFCDGCALGKAHRKAFKSRPYRATTVGEIINTDVNGPMSVGSLGGARYFACFKDDFSKYRRIFFLKKKSEVSSCLRMFLNEASNHGHVVKALRCDGGGEFDCDEVRQILAEKGTALNIGAPYTPEQNGAAERENRTIVELARSMMSTCRLPRSLWANACETAVYLLNHTGVSPEENKSSHELWTGQQTPKLDHLRVFGTECYAHIPKNLRRKFDDKSILGHLVGYVNRRDGYKIYIPSQNKIIKSRDVYFKPEKLCTTPVTVEVEEDLSEKCEEIPNDTNQSEEKPEIRRSNRQRSIPTWMESGEFLLANVAAVGESDNPSTYTEALSSSESDLWLDAMKEEMSALYENKTWELVDRPKGSKVINCRWVLKKKFNPDGTVARYRARLVAKGYAQKAGIDFDETFSPVARYDTVRSILAVIAKEQLHLKQFDVKTAFLYGILQEEVFMTQPEGFNDNSGRVCSLQKSLYGLKQAPRCWNQCFVNLMKEHGLEVSTADPCLFIRHRDKKKLFVVIYVDDGLVVGSDKVEVEEFMGQLAQSFKITIGCLNQFLGMNIANLSDGSIFVNQYVFTKKILSKFNMDCANPVSTPSDKSYVSNDKENNLIGKEIPYRQAVGSLMYLAIATRPDLSYAVSTVSENLENPRSSDWCAVKRIFKYLKGTVYYGLLYKANCPNDLEVYSDADYAGDTKTRRSRTGMISKFSGGAISWMSQKQRSVVLSTTEAEYVAASESAKELIWLKRLLNDITNLDTPSLLVDNASAVKLARNPEFHKRSKHVEVRYHFVREKFINGELHIKHVPGKLQIADIMTKPLSSVRYKELCTLIGLFPFDPVNV